MYMMVCRLSNARCQLVMAVATCNPIEGDGTAAAEVVQTSVKLAGVG
jgi:hypothetical protein